MSKDFREEVITIAEEKENEGMNKEIKVVVEEKENVMIKMEEIIGLREENKMKEKLWASYINYLYVWAEDHKNSVFYGETPACFDEWAEEADEVLEEKEENNMDELKKAISLISEYYYSEFDEVFEGEDLSEIGLAYTETDAGLPIQVTLDLKALTLSTYVDDVCVEVIKYDTLKEVNTNLLEWLDFDSLIYPYASEED